MHVSADAFWLHVSFTVEPRGRTDRAQAASGAATRLRDRCTLALRRASEPRLEDLDATQLADIGLRPDLLARWQGPDRSFGGVRRSIEGTF
jgi:hypothetical protein